MKLLFNQKNIRIMGIIEDKKKFKPNKKQSNPTNPTGNRNVKTNTFDIDEETIKKQQNKK
jgi:hypothetical protein